MFGKETKKEGLIFKIGFGLFIVFLWIITFLTGFEFYLLMWAIILTPIYAVALIMSLRRGAGSDDRSKTAPDRYGKSY